MGEASSNPLMGGVAWAALLRMGYGQAGLPPRARFCGLRSCRDKKEVMLVATDRARQERDRVTITVTVHVTATRLLAALGPVLTGLATVWYLR